VLSARTEEEAASVCALLLRETLETPGLTAALVTPDQELARRVAARLARWGVVADSSAGAPLAASPAAILAQHLAALAVDPLDPVRLLAVAQAPAAAGSSRSPPATWSCYGLRGPAPRDAGQLLGKLEPHPEARRLAERVLAAARQAAAPMSATRLSRPPRPRALVESLEALADPAELWAGRPARAWPTCCRR
jgi:ATP-dependent helicase/nuclease subunit B